MKTTIVLLAAFLCGCADESAQKHLRSKLESANKVIEYRDETIRSKDASIDSLQKEIAEKDISITKHESDLQDVRRKLRLAELEISKWQMEREREQNKIDHNKKVMSAMQEPDINISTNRYGKEIRTYTFPKMFDKDGNRITFDAEFQSLVGVKMIFRTPSATMKSGETVFFTVQEIHPAVLLYLGIDVGLSEIAQQKIDLANQLYAQNYALAMAQKIKDDAALKIELARIALEREKIMEEQRKQQEADMERRQYLANDTLKAEAAWRQATKEPVSIRVNNIQQNLNIRE